MSRMSKKAKVIAVVIVGVIVCAMLVVGYLTKTKGTEAPASVSVSDPLG